MEPGKDEIDQAYGRGKGGVEVHFAPKWFEPALFAGFAGFVATLYFRWFWASAVVLAAIAIFMVLVGRLQRRDPATRKLLRETEKAYGHKER